MNTERTRPARAASRRTADVLRERESLLCVLAEHARDIIYRYRLRPTRGFEYVSPAATAVTGYSPEEHYANPDLGFQIVHPEDRARLEQVAHEGRPGLVVLRWIRKDGQIIWTEQRNVPIYDAAGTLVAIEGIARDITERKQMEETLRASEDHFRALLEHTHDGIALLDARGTILPSPGPGITRILGYCPGELAGRPGLELVHPEDLPRAAEALRQLKETPGGHVTLQLRHRHKDGSWRWLEGRGTNLLQVPSVKAIVANYRDITEHKRMLEALAHSEAQHRLVLENIDEIVYQVTTPDLDLFRGRVQFVSPRVEHVIGYKPEDFVADPGLWFSLLHPDDVTAVIGQTEAMFARREGGTREYRLRHKTTGQHHWMEDKVRLQVDGTGCVVGIFGVARDITERKRAVAAYQTLVEGSLQGLVLLQEGRITSANPAAATIFGGTVEELNGLSPEGVVGLVHPEDRPLVFQRQKERLAGKPTPPHYEFRIVRKDGAVRWVEIFASLTHFQQRPAILTTFIDITERKQAEEALRQSEARFRQLAENIRDVFWMSDPGMQCIFYLSPAYEAIWGRPCESLRQAPASFLDTIFPADRPVVAAYLAKQQHQDAAAEYRIVRPDGGVRWIRDRAFPVRDGTGRVVCVTGVAEDITERQAAEEKLRRYTEGLHALSGQLLEVQEAERRRLALELHDQFGQELTSLKFNLEAAGRLTGAELQDLLRRAQGQLSRLLSAVRELSLELRPPMLETLGLLHTLAWHCDRFAAQFQIQVQFEHAGLEGRRFAPEVEIAAFRIVQEALTNVARHAGVAEACVKVRVTTSQLHLEVIDSGCGFDPEQATRARTSSGLSGMRERAILVGGELIVRSAAGGTRVAALLPLTQARSLGTA